MNSSPMVRGLGFSSSEEVIVECGFENGGGGGDSDRRTRGYSVFTTSRPLPRSGKAVI